jgi:gliding motility-associated-like protein
MPIKSGQSISLQASGADSYIWSPNQFINNVNTPNPEVNPPETKLYSVLGSVNNCLAKDSILVIVEGTEGLIMPNAFTPQGDGLNETFAPAFIGSFEFIKLSIYSRWGELLHQTVYPGGSWWNGTYKGVPCQDGVYFFRLEAKTNQGKEYFHSGNVTLIR